MTTFKVLATNHTSFTVSDLDRSLAFFRDGLGFEVTSRAPRDPALIQAITGVEGAELSIAYVRGPGHSLELIQYDGPADKGKVTSRPCDTGFAHLATTWTISMPPSPPPRTTGCGRSVRSRLSTKAPMRAAVSATSATKMESRSSLLRKQTLDD